MSILRPRFVARGSVLLQLKKRNSFASQMGLISRTRSSFFMAVTVFITAESQGYLF
jgi:hypothetical protein